jgi:hypothetical protein
MDFLSRFEISILPQPPYSPDIAPCDFSIFGNLKRMLKGSSFQDTPSLMEAVKRNLNRIDRRARIAIMCNWIARLKMLISTDGEFV